ncbi:MAG: DUF58 domain-containing protein [Rhodospirillales bacterium]
MAGAPARTAVQLHARAETAAAGVPALMTAAERLAAAVHPGFHGRRRAGDGETFWQFRAYAPGDSARRIDWRRSARAGHAYVRETEWEAARSICIARDASASMAYSSSPEIPTKRERADVIALALTILLTRGGERTGLFGADAPFMSGRAAVSRMAMMLAAGEGGAPEAASDTALGAALAPRHGVLVMIGDFLAPREDTAEIIRAAAARGISGCLVHIADPAEAALPFEGRVRYEGLEGEAPLVIGRSENMRGAYKQFFEDRIAALRAAAAAAGWGYVFHTSDRPAAPALLALHAALSAGRRTAARA